ncbi:hypothetical protein [Maritalea sp. S77]|uniref:hypothetical protein n=1 Tax=Maritalea sp. S77 TaxID=3415125 RepID=UPI003C7D3D90
MDEQFYKLVDQNIVEALVADDEVAIVLRVTFEVERAIDKLLGDVLAFNGENVGFATKCLMLRAMQLPQRVLDAVNLLRKIRNKFAHEPMTSLKQFSEQLEPLYMQKFGVCQINEMRLIFEKNSVFEELCKKTGLDPNAALHFEQAEVAGQFWFLGMALANELQKYATSHVFSAPKLK